MSSFRWTLLFAVLLSAFVSDVKTETTANPSIPEHLLKCYLNDGVYHRANRMPSTFESFIDLLKKVESSRMSRNMNPRELSLVLLHHLKVDGIVSLQPLTKFQSQNILPFALSGSEYFKHRLTLTGLIPKIDPSYSKVFNETLTVKELCNLHFMLSYSIDPYKREDERCDGPYDDNRRVTPEMDWDPYQRVRPAYYNRHRSRRSIQHLHKFNKVDQGVKSTEEFSKSLRKQEVEELEKILQKRTLESLREGSRPISKREIREHTQDLEKIQRMLRRSRRHSENHENKKADVEIVPPHYPVLRNMSVEKGKFTIDGQELLSNPESNQRKGMQSLVHYNSYGRQGGRYHQRAGQTMDEHSYGHVIPNAPLSDCPIVNGVIKTRYGPLTIGTVIAGIAAGLNPEDIPPIRLNVDPKDLESPMDRVKNVWGSTLAGVVADVLTSSAMINVDTLQILKGGWNESSDPKYYLLRGKEFNLWTEVGLRGGLDGLIVGLSAREWTSKFTNLKLSEILQIYYDCCLQTISAKNRAFLRPQFAPDEIFRKQVNMMSLVLKKQKPNYVTILDFKPYSREAVAKVNQFIQTMDEYEKSDIGLFPESKVDAAVNVVAVVDSSWGFENLMSIFNTFRTAEVASTSTSNLTVLCGSDGRTLFSVQNSGDLHIEFEKDAFYEKCRRGMQIPKVFEALDLLHRKFYHDEKISGKMNTNAKVALLLTYDSVLQENLDYAMELSRNFRHDFPDVRVMVGCQGPREAFYPLVKNQNDVFQIIPKTMDPSSKSVNELAKGIKQSFQRISRPSCGSYFDDSSVGGEIRETRDVGPGKIIYYRLLPQYFFKSTGTTEIRIRSKLRSPLTVCHSRENEYPERVTPRTHSDPDYNKNPNYNPNYNPEYSSDFNQFAKQTDDDGPTQCKTITSESYNIELQDPCAGASTLEDCPPLYISCSAPLQDSISISCQNCRLPLNVEYEITAVGLTCYNTAAAALINPFMLALVFVTLFSNNSIF